MILIGDLHGNFKWLEKQLESIKKNNDQLIILGDVGIGFPEKIRKFDYDKEIWKIEYGLSDFKYDPKYLVWLRGNHDSPSKCKNHPNYLGDYGMYKDIFYISGAFSIDKDIRIPGVDWWHDEELSISELNAAIDLFDTLKPDVVISHDCPQKILHLMHTHRISTRTGQALDQMLEIHQPKLWVFAHHHISLNQKFEQTTFICLNELEVLTL